MYKRPLFFLILFLVFVSLLSLYECTVFNKGRKDLWRYVYAPERLKIIKDSMDITGIVKSVHGELDGDYHIQIKVDSCYKYMLNDFNYKYQGGFLVIEIIRAKYSLMFPNSDYNNEIKIPKVGDYIKVNGSYVLDRIHGHMELHPVFSWEKLN
jgi:hypothetical protein